MLPSTLELKESVEINKYHHNHKEKTLDREVDEFVSSARRVVFNKETVFFFQWNLFRINELVKMITRITMEDADVLKHKLFVTIPCSQTHKKWILKTILCFYLKSMQWKK